MTSRMLVLLTVLCSLGAATGVACSSSGSSGTTSGAGGNGSGGSGSGGGGAGGGASACPNPPNLEAAEPACNTVTNGATAVPFTARTTAVPPSTGGSIRDGVYRSVRAEGYGAAPQNGRRLTIVILDGATRWLWAGDVLDAAGVAVVSSLRANAIVSVAGTSVSFTTSCTMTSPSPLPESLDFTVTGDELALSRTTATSTSVTTYMRVGCP